MTSSSVPGRARRCMRPTAAALALALLLPACQAAGDAAGLSPQQQLLRQQSERWNRTVATGALAGAALGAGSGALLSRDRGTGALIGGLVGAAAGAGAGLFVANRNLAFENRELSAGERIEAARQIAQNLDNAAATSERVASENRQKLAQLDRQFRSGQITAAQYRSETGAMQQDAAVMRNTAKDARDARERLLENSRQVPQLAGEESRIDSAQRRLERSASDLEAALRRVPTG